MLILALYVTEVAKPLNKLNPLTKMVQIKRKNHICKNPPF